MRRKKTALISDVELDSIHTEKTDVRPKIHNFPWPKILLVIALIAAILGGLTLTKTLSNINKSIADAKEESRPANIKLTKIITPKCTDCFSLDNSIATLKKQNVLVKDEKTVSLDSKDGQSLIRQFNIKRLPTYIFTGEATKKTIEGFVKSNGSIKNNTFIFTNISPVFVDAKTNKEIGKVTATILADTSCSQCIDPKLTIEAYKKAGVKIIDIKEIPWNSSEGQQLINKYKITKLPTFLLSSDIDYYSNIKANWVRIGTIENDKTYIARNLFLPYRDLGKEQILGLIDLIYLTDSSCSDCYAPEKIQRQILTQGYGIAFSGERTVDINSIEGQNLISQYQITKAPTIILSSNVADYVNLKNVWKSVGTVETDGKYVFRDMGKIGNVVYKDLTNNQIIRPVKQASNN